MGQDVMRIPKELATDENYATYFLHIACRSWGLFLGSSSKDKDGDSKKKKCSFHVSITTQSFTDTIDAVKTGVAYLGVSQNYVYTVPKDVQVATISLYPRDAAAVSHGGLRLLVNRGELPSSKLGKKEKTLVGWFGGQVVSLENLAPGEKWYISVLKNNSPMPIPFTLKVTPDNGTPVRIFPNQPVWGAVSKRAVDKYVVEIENAATDLGFYLTPVSGDADVEIVGPGGGKWKSASFGGEAVRLIANDPKRMEMGTFGEYKGKSNSVGNFTVSVSGATATAYSLLVIVDPHYDPFSAENMKKSSGQDGGGTTSSAGAVPGGVPDDSPVWSEIFMGLPQILSLPRVTKVRHMLYYNHMARDSLDVAFSSRSGSRPPQLNVCIADCGQDVHKCPERTPFIWNKDNLPQGKNVSEIANCTARLSAGETHAVVRNVKQKRWYAVIASAGAAGEGDETGTEAGSNSEHNSSSNSNEEDEDEENRHRARGRRTATNNPSFGAGRRLESQAGAALAQKMAERVEWLRERAEELHGVEKARVEEQEEQDDPCLHDAALREKAFGAIGDLFAPGSSRGEWSPRLLSSSSSRIRSRERLFPRRATSRKASSSSKSSKSSSTSRKASSSDSDSSTTTHAIHTADLFVITLTAPGNEFLPLLLKEPFFGHADAGGENVQLSFDLVDEQSEKFRLIFEITPIFGNPEFDIVKVNTGALEAPTEKTNTTLARKVQRFETDELPVSENPDLSYRIAVRAGQEHAQFRFSVLKKLTGAGGGGASGEGPTSMDLSAMVPLVVGEEARGFVKAGDTEYAVMVFPKATAKAAVAYCLQCVVEMFVCVFYLLV